MMSKRREASEMKGRQVLTVVRKGPAVLQLLTSEDQSLLVTMVVASREES
jgi:hypothetical protein